MSMTDPIADMLTRIRNANIIRLNQVDIPASNLKRGVADVLKRGGYIRDYRMIEDEHQGVLRVYLRYGSDGEFVISKINRVSKPGRRVYRPVSQVPTVLGGLGMAILSTSRGVLNDREAREQNVGGEVLAEVW